MQLTGHTAPAHTQLVFLSRMFDETMNMLLDAQEYFTHYAKLDMKDTTPVEKLVYSSEMSRVTLRLSSVMAWLLARRAESHGEITREEAATQFSLGFSDICLKDLPEMHHVLPSYMCELLTRSLELYRRAARLDTMIAEDATLH
jgi:hypothetical protein